MGMYTGLRCKVIIKPEYREEFGLLHNKLGYEWAKSKFGFMREFGQLSRASFIPRGALSYMPDSWENVPKKANGDYDWMNATDTDGFERQFNTETGYWAFQCSLKNYEDEIENFFENVLGNIAEEVIHLEYYYEEWESSTFYKLVDGKIVESEQERITYR
jgi:hypothetical protein